MSRISRHPPPTTSGGGGGGAVTFSDSPTIDFTPDGSPTSAVTAIVIDGSIDSAKIQDGTIVAADIASNAAIAFSQLANLPSAQILVGNGSNQAAAVAMSGDVTITNAGVTAIGTGKVTTTQILDGTIVSGDIASNTITSGNILDGTITGTDIASGTVTSTNILDGTIANADISGSAGIDFSKLAVLSSGNILVGSAGNVATSVAVTGDVTITNAGVTAIGTGKVTSTMILDGTITGTDIASGTVTTTNILDNTITGADINTAANVQLNSLGMGTAASGTAGKISWSDTSIDHAATAQLKIAPTANAAASTSIGGAVLIDNSNSTGAGLVVYSTQASPGGRLVNVRVNSTTADQAAMNVDYNGLNHAFTINHTTANDTSSEAMDITSVNLGDTVLGINGRTESRGIVKFTHSKKAADQGGGGDSSDSAGAVLRLNMQVDAEATATAVTGRSTNLLLSSGTFAVNSAVVFSGAGFSGTGITVGQTYYVTVSNAGVSFSVANTPGGTTVTLSGSPTGNVQVRARTAEQGIYMYAENNDVTTGALMWLFNGDSSVSGSERLKLSDVGQLQLPVQGSTAGLLLGTDTQIYRQAADVIGVASGDTWINPTQAGGTAAGDSIFTKPSTASGTGAIVDDLRSTSGPRTTMLPTTISSVIQAAAVGFDQSAATQSISVTTNGGVRCQQLVGTFTMDATSPNGVPFAVFNFGPNIRLGTTNNAANSSNAANNNLAGIRAYQCLPTINISGSLNYGQISTAGAQAVAGYRSGFNFARVAPATDTALATIVDMADYWAIANSIDAGCTVTNLRRFYVQAPTGAGTITNLTGLDIEDLNTFPIAPAPTGVAQAGAGLGTGNYRYRVTFVSAAGETSGGTGSAVIATTAGNNQVQLSNISVGPAGTTARNIYRTAVGGAAGSEKLIAANTVNDNTTTAYTDSTADGALGAAVPTASTFGQTTFISLRSLGTLPSMRHAGPARFGATGAPTASTAVDCQGRLDVTGDLRHQGTNAGFFNTAPTTKPTVTGSRGGNAALASLLTALAGLGLLTDSSTA